MKESTRKRIPQMFILYHTLRDYFYRACVNSKLRALKSKFIEHLDDVLKKEPNIPIVPYARVSTTPQKYNGNLDKQTEKLLKKLKSRGANIIYPVFREARNGSLRTRPDELLKACDKALEIKGVVVAISVDRIIRAHNYNPRNKQFYPLTRKAMAVFRSITRKARIATIEDPDTPDNVIHGKHTQRGMEGRKGMGRPPKTRPGYKKRRRQKYERIALNMRKEGKSYREIEAALDISHSTIWIWENKVSSF